MTAPLPTSALEPGHPQAPEPPVTEPIVLAGRAALHPPAHVPVQTLGRVRWADARRSAPALCSRGDDPYRQPLRYDPATRAFRRAADHPVGGPKA